jgi:hypothetical protein
VIFKSKLKSNICTVNKCEGQITDLKISDLPTHLLTVHMFDFNFCCMHVLYYRCMLSHFNSPVSVVRELL